MQVFAGNQPANVAYGGRAAFPGEDQINFVVPNVTGCKVSVAVLVKGITGNITTISVAPPGQTTCGDANDDLTAANLQQAMNSGQFSIGNVSMSHVPGGNELCFCRIWASFPVLSLIASYGGFLGPYFGQLPGLRSRRNFAGGDGSGNTHVFSTVGSEPHIAGPHGTKRLCPLRLRATIPARWWSRYRCLSPAGLVYGIERFRWPGRWSVHREPHAARACSGNEYPSTVNLAQDLTLTWSGGSAYPGSEYSRIQWSNVSGLAECGTVEFFVPPRDRLGPSRFRR